MQPPEVDTVLGKLRNLSSTGWLAEEPVAFRTRIARMGCWTSLGRGRAAYEVGDEPNAIFGLGSGLLDVLFLIDGSEEVLLHRAPPGFWIGDGMILTGMKRIVSVRAAVDCRLFAVPAGALRQCLWRNPEDWISMHRLAARNAELAVTVLAEALALPPHRRFARLLLRTATPDGIVRATQEELGHLMGMSRMAFRRAFRTFIETGVVRTEYGCVRIVDHDRLARIARVDNAD